MLLAFSKPQRDSQIVESYMSSYVWANLDQTHTEFGISLTLFVKLNTHPAHPPHSPKMYLVSQMYLQCISQMHLHTHTHTHTHSSNNCGHPLPKLTSIFPAFPESIWAPTISIPVLSCSHFSHSIAPNHPQPLVNCMVDLQLSLN